MKNVYIVYEYSSSKINGIGTYIPELTYCLNAIGVKIYMIAFYHDSKTFKIEVKDGIRQMQLPDIQGFFGQYSFIIDKFFRLYIEDSQENTFLFNITPSELLIKTIKASFPLSKIAFTIHDMTWTSFMYGDKDKLIKYATNENQKLFEKKYPVLFPYFNEEKRMYKSVHRIITLTNETDELLQSIYKVSDKKISYIPNGLRDNYFRLSKIEKNQLKAKLYIPLHEKVIIFAGRVLNVKGIYQVINSLKIVVKTYPDFRLIVVGTIIDVKKMMEYVDGVASKITFTGQISKDKLNELYQIADIGVLTSHWEQCSYTGIEMMMHGLPVIASDGFCVDEMFKEGINAKIAQIGDRNYPKIFENNISEAFLELLQSDELRKKLGTNGRKIYESKYHIKYMKEGYRMLLDSL